MIDRLEFARGPVVLSLVIATFAGAAWSIRLALLGWTADIDWDDYDRDPLPHARLARSTNRESGDSFSGSTSGSSTGRPAKNRPESPGPHRSGDSGPLLPLLGRDHEACCSDMISRFATDGETRTCAGCGRVWQFTADPHAGAPWGSWEPIFCPS